MTDKKHSHTSALTQFQLGYELDCTWGDAKKQLRTRTQPADSSK